MTHPLHTARLIEMFPKIRISIFYPHRLVPMITLTGKDYRISRAYCPTEPTHWYLVFDKKPFEQVGHWLGLRDLAPYIRGDIVNDESSIQHKQVCHMCFNAFIHGARNNVENHNCVVHKCKRCHLQFETLQDLNEHCKPDKDDRQDCVCTNCGNYYFNSNCRTIHLDSCKGKTNRCERCDQVYAGRKSQHVCGGYLCNFCQKQVPNDHTCYMRLKHRQTLVDDNGVPIPITEEIIQEELKQFYAFDFESEFLQGEPIRVVARDAQGVPTGGPPVEISTDEHHVNYVVIRQMGDEGEEWCLESLEDMVEWMEDRPEGGFLLAHNMKGYDGRLLFNHLINVGKAPESCVWVGTKVMSMSCGKWTIRDTLTHCAFPLEQMTSVFGLNPDEYAKGFFPYKFNRPENRNYVGPMPSQAFYEPDMMSPKKRLGFMEWYANELVRRRTDNEPYNFWEELKKYCISDTRLLAKAMEIYVREGMTTNMGLNPLRNCTIASYALKVYRNIHMPAETMVHLSPKEEEFARKALHGGRTDVRQMLKYYSKEDIQQGVYGCYQDVQSLYPTVQFYDPMPVGRCDKLYFHDRQPTMTEVRSWFGFVECDLEVVEEQFHPVVVGKSPDTHKLVADLNDKKRIVLTTPELFAALDNGYRLTRVYEVHKYTPSHTLFRSYIQQFLKVKIEASGMPKHIKTESDWQVFAQYHKDELGVELDRESMIKNPGKKQLAKLMLNSLWGKFAERKHWTNYTTFKPNDVVGMYCFENRYDRGEVDILYRFHESRSGQLTLIYREDPDFVDVRNQDSYVNLASNVAVAAFVTANGALRLWREMAKLGDRVLYHDTDSVIYERDPYGYNIPLGKYLGEWEDETGGEPIVAFVSTGPKTYAYKVRQEAIPFDEEDVQELEKQGIEWEFANGSRNMIHPIKSVCKAKGFTLNTFNTGRINFNSMRDLVLDQIQSVSAKSLKFQYRRGAGMYTREEWKELTCKYNKGIVDDQFKVWPFGIERFRDDRGPRRGLVTVPARVP